MSSPGIRKMAMRFRLADSLFVSLLILYVLGGIALTPFHGDESTIIAMSRDWYTLAVERNFAAVFYRDPSPDPAAQELRLANGVVAKYAIGLELWLAGIPADRLPSQWEWGADWNYNRSAGHMPDDQVLFVARLASALMTALSVALVFAIGRHLGGRRGAWCAALVYATMPAVLINGRRAMFEGAMLLTLTLVIFAGLLAASPGRLRRRWLFLGAAAGLAVASKHTALIVLVPIFGMLLWLGRRKLRQTLVYLCGAGLVTGGVFLALNPAWWSAPLRVPGEVLRLRANLIQGQQAFFGAHTDLPARLVALVEQPLGDAQYYEDSQGWPDWIGGQIAAYQSAGTAGLPWGRLGVLAVLTMLSGAAVMVRRVSRHTFAALFLAITGFTLLALFITNPLPWQRYYMPLTIPLAVLLGLGFEAWGRVIWRIAGSLLRSSYA
jgi:4-amino-4-deoxy-L-arabinose transferase-like glycosyltransferase